MNKKEVKFDHFKDIEELIKHLEMWYAEDDYFAYERYFHLRDARIMGMFIYELQQENQKYKEVINKAINYIEEYRYITDKVTDEDSLYYGKDITLFAFNDDNVMELLDILEEVE